MKLLLSLMLVGVVAAGCAHKQPNQLPVSSTPGMTSASTNMPPMIVTPANTLTGKVVSYNSVGRFVVVSFAMGQMPAVGRNLYLYRAGLKVGEIRITGPQRDEDTVADLISGEAQVGDEVRDQ